MKLTWVAFCLLSVVVAQSLAKKKHSKEVSYKSDKSVLTQSQRIVNGDQSTEAIPKLVETTTLKPGAQRRKRGSRHKVIHIVDASSKRSRKNRNPKPYQPPPLPIKYDDADTDQTSRETVTHTDEISTHTSYADEVPTMLSDDAKNHIEKSYEMNKVPSGSDFEHVHSHQFDEVQPEASNHHNIEHHKQKVKVKHHHHHHHHNHVKEIIKKVPEPYPVEKIVHVPKPYAVEKIVEKKVPYPVEKIVEKKVPYPVEKIIEKKVPYPVEKIVHVPVEKVIHVPQPYPVEKIVEKKVPYPVEKIVEKKIPVEKIVEKIVHVPVEKIVEKKVPYPVEKIVEKKIPYPVEKIVHIPVEKIVEKIVHVPVEKIVEKPIHIEKKIPYPVEKIVHVPVEKIVEKVIHVPVEKIIHVPKPYPVEKIIEKKVPYPVEKIVHVPVEKIVEKIVEVPKPYPVRVPIHIPVPKPYPVEKKVPVPIKVEVEKKVPIFIHHKEPEHHQSFDGDYGDGHHINYEVHSNQHDHTANGYGLKDASVAPSSYIFHSDLPRTLKLQKYKNLKELKGKLQAQLDNQSFHNFGRYPVITSPSASGNINKLPGPLTIGVNNSSSAIVYGSRHNNYQTDNINKINSYSHRSNQNISDSSSSSSNNNPQTTWQDTYHDYKTEESAPQPVMVRRDSSEIASSNNVGKLQINVPDQEPAILPKPEALVQEQNYEENQHKLQIEPSHIQYQYIPIQPLPFQPQSVGVVGQIGAPQLIFGNFQSAEGGPI